MPAACPISNLSPEQQAAGKRVAMVFFVIKGLQLAGMAALVALMLTGERISPPVGASGVFVLALLGLIAGRICTARMKQIETGVWPRRSAAGWLCDAVLVTMLAIILAMMW